MFLGRRSFSEGGYTANDPTFSLTHSLNPSLKRPRFSPVWGTHLPCTDFQSPLYEGLASPVLGTRLPANSQTARICPSLAGNDQDFLPGRLGEIVGKASPYKSAQDDR